MFVGIKDLSLLTDARIDFCHLCIQRLKVVKQATFKLFRIVQVGQNGENGVTAVNRVVEVFARIPEFVSTLALGISWTAQEGRRQLNLATHL